MMERVFLLHDLENIFLEGCLGWVYIEIYEKNLDERVYYDV